MSRIIGHSLSIKSGELILIDPNYLTKKQQKVLKLDIVTDRNVEFALIKNKEGINYAILLRNFGGNIVFPVILKENGDVIIKFSVEWNE